MYKTNRILVTLAIVATFLSRGSPAFSQTVSPMVVASIGGDTLIANTNISWTLGEAVIATVSTGTNTLTQGFQQPNWLMVGIIETAEDDIKVFPNPTPGMVNVHVGTQNFNAAVYDILGQIVIKPPNISGSTQIDLGQLAPANYILVLTNSTRSYTIQLVKIQ